MTMHAGLTFIMFEANDGIPSLFNGDFAARNDGYGAVVTLQTNSVVEFLILEPVDGVGRG